MTEKNQNSADEEGEVEGEERLERSKEDETPIYNENKRSSQRNTKIQIDIETEKRANQQKLIVGLTWPALAENILSSVTSMVDMVMVGNLGSYAINAVGLVIQPKFVMLAAFMALGVGSTAMAARFKGARDEKNANLVFNQTLSMTLILTFVLCIAMLLGGEGLIRMLSGDKISEETIRAALSYLRIQVYGFPFLSVMFAINAVLRGVGNTKASFYNNTAANVINVILNYAMIEGHWGFPALGVAGASLATIIGQFVAMLMAIGTVLRGKEYIRFDLANIIRLDTPMLKRLLNIGLPAFLEQVIMRAGVMIFTRIVTSLGDIPYTAHQIAMNIQQLAFTTGMSFGAATTTLVGQSLGRSRSDLAKVYVKMTQQLGLIVAAVVAFLLFFFGEGISGLYSKEAEIIVLAGNMLKIIALANPVSSARFVYIAALRGAGDSTYPAFISFIGVMFIRPVISFVLTTPSLPIQLGLMGVWIALVSDSVVCFIIAYLRYRNGKWQSIRI